MAFNIKLNNPHAMTRRSQVTGKRYYDATFYRRQYNRNNSKICAKMHDMCDIEIQAFKYINGNFLKLMLSRLNILI
jgi:hypothetical protein